MMENITVRQGYLASYYFLQWIYFNIKKHDDDLPSLLGDMNPHIWKNAMSGDPATWFEWLDCMDSIEPGVRADAQPELRLIHPDVAYNTMRVFLKLYDDQDLYHTKWLMEAMQTDPAMRAKWNQFLRK